MVLVFALPRPDRSATSAALTDGGAVEVPAADDSWVMMTTLVVGPFYLSRVFGLSAMAAGFVLSIGPMVGALTGVPAGRFVDRIGAHRVAILGLIGIAGGALGVVAVPATLGIGGYVGPLALMTASYASFQAANNTAIMSGVRDADRGMVAGLLSLSRNLGLITGAAVMAAVFANRLAPDDPMTATSDAVAAGMRITFARSIVAMFACVPQLGSGTSTSSPGFKMDCMAR